MCMKYINVNTSCYESLSTIGGHIVSFNAPLNSVGSVDENGDISTDKFVIVTQIGFLGTNNEEHKKENVLCCRDRVDIIIRLTKRSKDVEKRLGLDLDTFTIDLKDVGDMIETACFEYYNYTRITNVNGIKLSADPGQYILKVLVKKQEDDSFTIQSMNSLVISEPIKL